MLTYYISGNKTSVKRSLKHQ